MNLSYSSTSSNASPLQTPKTKEINRLREENRRLKDQLEQALSVQPDRHSEHDDDDVQDADGRYKDWSQLGTFQKRKLVCDIETKLKLLADKKDTGIVNIAASIISRFNYNPCNESERLYNYCKRRNASGLLITCYDYIGVEKFAAR